MLGGIGGRKRRGRQRMRWWDGITDSDQSLSRVWLFATPWIAARQASLSIHQLPEFTETHVHRVSDAIPPSHPLSSPSPPAPNPSQHVFVREIWISGMSQRANWQASPGLHYPSRFAILFWPQLLCVRNEIVQKHRIPNGIQQDDISNYWMIMPTIKWVVGLE